MRVYQLLDGFTHLIEIFDTYDECKAYILTKQQADPIAYYEILDFVEEFISKNNWEREIQRRVKCNVKDLSDCPFDDVISGVLHNE